MPTKTHPARELIEQAEQAWRNARVAKTNAMEADYRVKKYLVGRRVVVTGSAAPISGGTIHRDRRKHLSSEPVVVTAVFYYLNEEYRNREDTFRFRAGDGSEYEMVLSTCQFELEEE